MVDSRIKKVLGVDNTAEIVETATADWNNQIGVALDDIEIVFSGILQIEPYHLSTCCHKRVSLLVAHVENAVNHSLLSLFKGAILGALFNKVFYFILSDSILDFMADTKYVQDYFGREGKYTDNRLCPKDKTAQGLLTFHESTLWCLQGKTARYELT